MFGLRLSALPVIVLTTATLLAVHLASASASADTIGLPPQTPFEKSWKFDKSELKGPRYVVVRTQKQWEALWKEHDPNSKSAPTVDFERLMVVGFVVGEKEKQKCVYRIELDNAAEPTLLDVRVSLDGGITQVPKHTRLKGAEAHFVVTPKSALPVRFRCDVMVDAGVNTLIGPRTYSNGRTQFALGGVEFFELENVKGLELTEEVEQAAEYREQAEKAVAGCYKE